MNPIIDAQAQKSVANPGEHSERGDKANRDAEKYPLRELAQKTAPERKGGTARLFPRLPNLPT